MTLDVLEDQVGDHVGADSAWSDAMVLAKSKVRSMCRPWVYAAASRSMRSAP
jgi:hypothetical protein